MSLDLEALYRVLFDSTERLPDTEVIDRPDWIQLRTPSSKLVQHNKVLRAVLDEKDVDRVIAEVLEDHAERGAAIAWSVDGVSQPRDLSARLLAAGLPRLGEGLGMYRSTDIADVDLPSGIRIAHVGLDDIDTFVDLTCRAWPRPRTFASMVGDLVRKSIERPELGSYHFIAHCDDEPVGTASLVMFPSNIAYMRGAAVLPEFRGRGIYTALMRRRLAYCAAEGRDTAIIWANPDTSAPVARQLGFIEVPGAHVSFHDTHAPYGA